MFSSLCFADFVSGGESVFSMLLSVAGCDWFVTSSHGFDVQLDHESTITLLSLTDFFHSYFIKAKTTLSMGLPAQ